MAVLKSFHTTIFPNKSNTVIQLILLQLYIVNLVTFVLHHDCIRLLKNFITGVIMSLSLLQVVGSASLFQPLDLSLAETINEI